MILFPKINILNIPITVVDYREVEGIVVESLENKKLTKIGFVNAHYANLAVDDPVYKCNLLKHDYLLNDGIGLDIAVRMKGKRFKANMVGTDLIPYLLDVFKTRRVFLLGGTNDALASAVKKMTLNGVNLVGYHSGYFDDSPPVLKQIANSDAEILLIGMGAPHQEAFIAHDNKHFGSVKVVITGGAIIDFIGGIVPRAPTFVRKLRLEWLYRLILEPKRLFWRYVVGNPLFLLRAFKDANSERKS